MSRVIGTVVELARFPVKSMAGERPAAVELDWQGIEGDRQFAFYRTGDRGRFPWLSGRDLPELLLPRARFRDPDNPRRSPVEVATPDGTLLRSTTRACSPGLPPAPACRRLDWL